VYIWILGTSSFQTRKRAKRFRAGAGTRLAGVAGRSYKTEAIVLRSFRLGEADRVLHLYTLDRGRVGAVASRED